MRKIILAACLSLIVQPAIAQTVTDTNLPNPLTVTLSDGTSRGWVCHDSPICNQIDLQRAQQDGFFLPPAAPAAPAAAHHGGNFDTGLAVGIGAAVVVGVGAWLLFGRDRPTFAARSPTRFALSIPVN